jgi:phosphoribosylanthranilate isomerase
MTFIKICGITNIDDALAAVALGADALGFNFYKPSPRYLSPASARAIIERLLAPVLKVGVFVNEEAEAIKRIANEAGLSALQLHGDESPDYCQSLAVDHYVIKTLAVSEEFDKTIVYAYDVEAIMLDTRHRSLRGGTGRAFDWSIAREIGQAVPKLFLAGGLSPENVYEAIETVRPYAVDACSALETRPGIKDHARMGAFVEVVREM